MGELKEIREKAELLSWIAGRNYAEDIIKILDRIESEAKQQIVDYVIQLDGSSYCATAKGFRNLQEDEAGFGDTPEAALVDLLNRKSQILSKQCEEVPERTWEMERDICLELFGDHPDAHTLNMRVTKLIAYRDTIRADDQAKVTAETRLAIPTTMVFRSVGEP